jgi:rubrerythrin
MSGKQNEQILYTLLKDFLKWGQVKYQPVTTRVIAVNPLQISQDEFYYIELTGLGKELKTNPILQKKDFENYQVNLRLIDWKFVYCRIPNNVDFYIDIEVSKYEIVEQFDIKGVGKPSKQYINILDTNPYSALLEKEIERRASEFESIQTPETARDSAQKIASSLLETKGDSTSNHNTGSLRIKSPNSKLSAGKDTSQETAMQPVSTFKKLEYGDAGRFRNPPTGIGVKGINGEKNMKKLKQLRSNFANESQDSITDQFLSNISQISEIENVSSLQKRAESSERLPEFMPLEENQSQYIRISDRDLVDSGKKLKMTQKSEVTFSNAVEPLSYDELMECLSLEKNLINWEELEFNKEVVKYLKGHLKEFVNN